MQIAMGTGRFTLTGAPQSVMVSAVLEMAGCTRSGDDWEYTGADAASAAERLCAGLTRMGMPCTVGGKSAPVAPVTRTAPAPAKAPAPAPRTVRKAAPAVRPATAPRVKSAPAPRKAPAPVAKPSTPPPAPVPRTAPAAPVTRTAPAPVAPAPAGLPSPDSLTVAQKRSLTRKLDRRILDRDDVDVVRRRIPRKIGQAAELTGRPREKAWLCAMADLAYLEFLGETL